jgi:S1-C subfamily serine protease
MLSSFPCAARFAVMMHALRLPLLLALLLLVGELSPACAQEPSPAAVVSSLEDVLVEVIAKAERSVVAIARVEKAQPGENQNFEFRPDPFGRRVSPVPPPGPTDPEFMPNEFATGVVVGSGGLILTAYHVLGENSEYFVTAHDRKVYRAWVKAADPRSDLAVLAIDATDLVPVAFGDSSSLKKGQIVVALGNPYAIARDGQVSASWGIVSNLARKAPPIPDEPETSGKTTLHHFGTLIQTDAKLNLGTSGGPLLNLQGQMVGLVTALAAAAGYEQAAGYAFPVDDTFRRVVDQLKQGREVEYGYLGIQPVNLMPEDVLRGLHGTRLHRVMPGTPADRYGLKAGDRITEVNGVSIYDADGLVLEVGQLPVESVVRLAVVRGTQHMNLDVSLTKYPVRGRKIITTPAPAWRGMRVDYASAAGELEGGNQPRLPFYDEGVLVSGVEEGTPAWEAGLRKGMLISQVEQVAVHSPADFRNAVANKRGPVQLRLSGENADPPVRTVPAGS